MRLLILGGTTEASALARHLAGRRDIAPVLSLAGRTERPTLPPIPCRVGGFGGIEGLAAYLRAEAIAAVIDATHPFAARMSAHAAAACTETGVPLAAFTREGWDARLGDDWTSVVDLDAAVEALGEAPRRVFLTSGRLGLAAFRAAPQHDYLLRSIDPPPEADRPSRCEVVLGRGPFDVAAESALMRRHGIEILVTKNSGGDRAKLDAARSLGVPVVLVERPAAIGGTTFTTLDAVLAWIDNLDTTD
ncbi:MAG TPA: cobalt-precorrin-6A reductase [Lichenihabitans sp.]|jgi:precorrin-6A/cobalt-precorrin-6A reductase|nr:cobalt-precorrin-6A reductase [Lichenihabitans sp.]